MQPIHWDLHMNFASALLLHSCLTLLTKEIFNALVILHRLSLSSKGKYGRSNALHSIRSSAILDAYTSIFCNDPDGELAELYYTNTGVFLLLATLSASVAMNLYLSALLLNIWIAATFVCCFLASMVVGKKSFTLPITSLRRAGRFIWADTPFVNFFTLIYVATVLQGNSATLRVKDYVTFRCIAVLELLFMKAKLAASNPASQEMLMKRLTESEVLVLPSKRLDSFDLNELPLVTRDNIAAFQTYHRMSTMLFKTNVSYANGGLLAEKGPCRVPLPAVGKSVIDLRNGLRICRPSSGIVILIDCSNMRFKKGIWEIFLARAHGILLRRLGKVRVVYLVKAHPLSGGGDGVLQLHSNINLVTGVSRSWLDEYPEEPLTEYAVVAGN